MNNMTTFYVVRHGESEGNANHHKGVVTPPSEFGTDLTAAGIEQVKKVAGHLKNTHFDGVYSSDLLRAKRTAEIIALERKLAVKATKVLRERNFGKHGENIRKLRDDMQPIISQLTEEEKMSYKHTPDMESAEEAAIRLLTFLRETALAYPNTTMLIINHGATMRALLIHLGYAKYDDLLGGTVPNTAYLVLETDGSDFIVKETHEINKKYD